jgi:hypothetical protein
VRSTNRAGATTGKRAKTFSLSLRAPRRKTKPQCFSVLYYKQLKLASRARRMHREYLSAKAAAGDAPLQERGWLIGHAPQSVAYSDHEDGDDGSAPPSSDEDSASDDARPRSRKSQKKAKKTRIPLSFKTAVANAAFEAATPEQLVEVDNLFESQAEAAPAEGSAESRCL